VQRLLAHLYVLIPVLDAQKHYWVGEAEVEKLLRHGDAWLVAHPDRELIARRYLRRSLRLARAALARLEALDDAPADDDENAESGAAESAEQVVVEKPIRLQERRIAAVLDVLKSAGASSVVDLGCGSGDLLLALARDRAFERIAGADVSTRELERAQERLDRVHMPASRRARVSLFQSSVLYRDARVAGFDAAALLEVVEHIELDRLPSLTRALFGAARPKLVVLTTPNREYNAHYETLANGAMRHGDHRFEWTRAEFRAWADATAAEHGYTVSYVDVGDVDEALGAPTQMALFACN